MIGSMLLARLDERDRALFTRWSVSDSDRHTARRLWTFLTHLGGVSCSVGAAVLPLTASGELPDGRAPRADHAHRVAHHRCSWSSERSGRPRPSRDELPLTRCRA